MHYHFSTGQAHQSSSHSARCAQRCGDERAFQGSDHRRRGMIHPQLLLAKGGAKAKAKSAKGKAKKTAEEGTAAPGRECIEKKIGANTTKKNVKYIVYLYVCSRMPHPIGPNIVCLLLPISMYCRDIRTCDLYFIVCAVYVDILFIIINMICMYPEFWTYCKCIKCAFSPFENMVFIILVGSILLSKSNQLHHSNFGLFGLDEKSKNNY